MNLRRKLRGAIMVAVVAAAACAGVEAGLPGPQGTPGVSGIVGVSNGGTGQSSYTTGDLLYASSSTALSRLAAGTSGYALTSNGAGMAPSYQAAGGGASTLQAAYNGGRTITEAADGTVVISDVAPSTTAALWIKSHGNGSGSVAGCVLTLEPDFGGNHAFRVIDLNPGGGNPYYAGWVAGDGIPRVLLYDNEPTGAGELDLSNGLNKTTQIYQDSSGNAVIHPNPGNNLEINGPMKWDAGDITLAAGDDVTFSIDVGNKIQGIYGGATPFTVPSVLSHGAGDVAVVNTTTETNAYSYTVPGFMLNREVLRVQLYGSLSSKAVGPGTLTIKGYYGADALTILNGVTLTGGDSSVPVRILFEVIASGNGIQTLTGSYDDSSITAPLLSRTRPASSTTDGSMSQVLKLTVKFGTADSANSFTAENVTAEWLP